MIPHPFVVKAGWYSFLSIAAFTLYYFKAASSLFPSRSQFHHPSFPSSAVEMLTTASSTFHEGFADFEYQGETYKTYYKVFGDLKNGTQAPLVALHGGPGLVHQAVLPFSELATIHGIPIILYDQLGNGKSTHLKDKDSSFWTIDLFLDELANLLNHLGIQDKFNLAGHSWGGILASEFTVRRHPAGLQRLILTNTLASFALWIKSTTELLQPFPDWVKEGIATGMKDPQKYWEALQEFHAAHGCTVKPFPEPYVYALQAVFGPDRDETVASQMSGLLGGWSIIDRAHLINVPTLLLNGKKDIAQDFVVRPFFESIPKVKWVTFQNSSHTPFFEEPVEYFNLIASFLKPSEGEQ